MGTLLWLPLMLQVKESRKFRSSTTLRMYHQNLHIDLFMLKSVVAVLSFSPFNNRKIWNMQFQNCELCSVLFLFCLKRYIYDGQSASRAQIILEKKNYSSPPSLSHILRSFFIPFTFSFGYSLFWSYQFLRSPIFNMECLLSFYYVLESLNGIDANAKESE